MKMLVDKNVVYKSKNEKFLVGIADFYEYLNKQLGIWHRGELNQRFSHPLIRSMKLYAYESMGWCLGLAAHTVSWVSRQFS